MVVGYKTEKHVRLKHKLYCPMFGRKSMGDRQIGRFCSKRIGPVIFISVSALLIAGNIINLEQRVASSNSDHARFFADHIVTPLECPSQYKLNSTVTQIYGQVAQSSLYDSSKSTKFTDKILILTPISNSQTWLHHYYTLLCSLNYPHRLISIALGEDSSQDSTLDTAIFHAKKLGKYFRSIKVFKLSGVLKHNATWDRHYETYQHERRTHLAKSRNQLLFNALSDENWVLWLDSDVKYVPPDLVQHLLAARKDITVSSCMVRIEGGIYTVYDKNTWQETTRSKTYLENLPKDELVLEGYGESKRVYLPNVRSRDKVVPVDGVGGCALLVRSQCHKKGLIFPPFVFDHHIETEGLAKMAKSMNYSVFGLPEVFVFHF